MHVIGTAGHVDHGKSTLIAALTGIHPDRLKEEQEREMTIDLGFAWLILPSGEEIGIIDVPGHQDFIDNMIAGVGGIDAALLVIAADEGIMPQTREHLAILDLLQIQSGIIVLSKIDLVDDPEWLDIIEMDIRSSLQRTVYQNAPIQRVSSITHAGFPELLDSISNLLQTTTVRPNHSKPRLPVDRVFSIAGFGTVVTGTLSDGVLTSGEEVEMLPSGIKGRIRGLQSHKKKEETANPGSRTAVNISGMNLDQIKRGELVTYPGQYQTTQRLDVSFRLLKDVSTPFHHHTEVKFYLGTSETIAEARLLGTEILYPGETGWLQLELRTPVVAVRGDRYILRRPSPGEILGGGSVVDPHPSGRHKRFDLAVLQGLTSTEQGSPSDILMQASLALGVTPIKEIGSRSQLESHMVAEGINELFDSGQLVKLEEGPWTLDSVVVPISLWIELKKKVATVISAYHIAHPLRHGMPREELKSRLNLTPRPFNMILQKLVAEGRLIEGPKWVALPEHKVRFSPYEQVKVDKLINLFERTPHTPPSIKECLAEVGEDVFNALREAGDLVAVSDEIVFEKKIYDVMVGKIRLTLQEQGQISLAQVRDILQTTRKYAQPLLEHLDVLGVTVREGDIRRLRT
jgi:selenocysteine-specific elongation factor